MTNGDDEVIFEAPAPALGLGKVSLIGVDLLWGDCTFIPANWGS